MLYWLDRKQLLANFDGSPLSKIGDYAPVNRQGTGPLPYWRIKSFREKAESQESGRYDEGSYIGQVRRWLTPMFLTHFGPRSGWW